MLITEISSLEPTSAVVIYTDSLETTIEEAINKKEIGERGFRFNKDKAALLQYVYLATPINVPGKIRTIHITAKAHISGITDGDAGVIFKVDKVTEEDLYVHARFGDVRNAFMYCDDYHLETTIKQREQNKKMIAELTADPEKARLFLVQHKPNDFKISREKVPELVQRFIKALTPNTDVLYTAHTILGL